MTNVNPAYFENADRRIEHLLDSEIMPAIVGTWSFHNPGRVSNLSPGKENIYQLTAPAVKHLEPGVDYRAFLFDPTWGTRIDLGRVEKSPPSPDRLSAGSDPLPFEYHPPQLPSPQDWVLVLERNKPL